MKITHVISFTLALAFAALTVLGLSSPALAAKSALAERYDVDITILADGSLDVTETVIFRYTGGPFTYVKREIPAAYTDGLQFVSARMDGVLLPQGKAAGQVEIQGGSKMTVTWHFAGVSDSTHNFTLAYRALGVVQKKPAADQLTYTALPREHDYLIAASTVQVRYPSTARLQGQPAFRTGLGSIEAAAGLVTFQAVGLGEDQFLEVQLDFAPGSLTTTTPSWQAREQIQAERTRQTMPAFLAASLAALAGGGAGLWLFQRRTQPEPLAGLDTASSSPLVPSGLPPAGAAALLSANGQPPVAGLTGTLFDLARRGVLYIEEIPKKGLFSSRDFEIRLQQLEELRPFEQSLLEMLFKTPVLQPGLSASLKHEAERLAQNWQKITPQVTDDLLTAGQLDPGRRQSRQRWLIVSVLAMIAALGLLVGLIVLSGELGRWVVLIGGVLLVLSVAWIILAAGLTPLSDQGRLEAARWKAFRDYLKDIARGREPATRPDQFEHYLPYAAAFGFAPKWARFFQKQGVAEVPGWFHPLTSDGSEMAAFIGMVDSTSASAGDGGAGAGGSAGGGSSSTG